MLWKAWRARPEKILSMRPLGFSWSETDKRRSALCIPCQAEKGGTMGKEQEMDENIANLLKNLRLGVGTLIYESVEDGSDVAVPDTARAKAIMKKAASVIEDMTRTISRLELENERMTKELSVYENRFLEK